MFDFFLRKIPLWFFAAAILCLHPALFAQDEDGWSGFSSFGFPGGPEDGGFASDSFSGSPFSFALETEMTARAMLGGGYLDGYFHDSHGGDLVFLDPSAKLDFGYASEKTDFRLVLRADRDVLAFWPQDIIGEFTARAYLGDFVLEAGKMKVVWGKGDEVHVVDNFNANDYTNFIFPSYIDRRIAEPMLRLVWNGANLRAEAVYTPVMTADRFAEDGPWVPGPVRDLSGRASSAVLAQADAALKADNAGLLLAALSAADSLVPDTSCFDYGQAGFRLTGTAGLADWGVSYYIGHRKQVSAVWDAAQDLPELGYDRLQVFGLEGAAALGRFNLRAEAAYWMTEDFAGTDPGVHNHSVQWVAGFDVDLPIHNLNVNIQNNGAVVLHGGETGSPLDVDYDAKQRHTNNKIILRLSDSFLYEKLNLELRFLWGIERADFILFPSVRYNVSPELEFALSGMYITGKEDSEFSYWQDNSFVQLGVKYTF